MTTCRQLSSRWKTLLRAGQDLIETSKTLVARAEHAFAGIAGPPALCPHNILFGGRKMWAADEMGARGRGGGYLRQEHHHHQDLWGVWETQVAPLAAAPLMMLN